MTLPRPIYPDTTYLVTRRCVQRQFLLRPCPRLNEVLRYCLAYAASRTGVLVHAFCAMSNHVHLVVTDPGSRLPAFMAWFDEYVGKCMNALRKRWGATWEPGSYSMVRLETEEAVLDKIVYTLANPVKAGLVAQGTEWPGVRLGPEEVARPVEVPRPTVYFDPKGDMPEKVLLRVSRPSQVLAELDDEAYRRQAMAGVWAQEAEQRQQRRQEGRGFLGRRGVLQQVPTDCPARWEKRRGLKPRVASRGDVWRRLEALQRLKRFLEAYREAWKAFGWGNRTVEFPAGTYALRVLMGVACAAPS